jgi:multidrug efflux pump subunit AcrB
LGFVAVLGAMSRAGMMVKNAIVLLDEVNVNLTAGNSPYRAVVDSAVSRLRPVVLGGSDHSSRRDAVDKDTLTR